MTPLEKMIQRLEYVDLNADGAATLDGSFHAEELRAIADLMDEGFAGDRDDILIMIHANNAKHDAMLRREIGLRDAHEAGKPQSKIRDNWWDHPSYG